MTAATRTPFMCRSRAVWCPSSEFVKIAAAVVVARMFAEYRQESLGLRDLRLVTGDLRALLTVVELLRRRSERLRGMSPG